MTLRRMDSVGIVVDDLAAAVAFCRALRRILVGAHVSMAVEQSPPGVIKRAGSWKCCAGLLSHQAGLPVIEPRLTFEEALAWDPVIWALEAQKPLWRPGTEHVYHSMTFGYLVGEIVRRISGKSLGTFFADEVARPLALNAWIGLPEDQEPKVCSNKCRP